MSNGKLLRGVGDPSRTGGAGLSAEHRLLVGKTRLGPPFAAVIKDLRARGLSRASTTRS